MDWFYEDDTRKIGPVTETEIKTLVKDGKITGGTKVWNEKISKWVTYGELMGGVVAEVPAVTVNQAEHTVPHSTFDDQEVVAKDSTCIECGRTFPVDEMVQHGEFNVCASCKNVFFQKVKEGVSTGDMVYGGFWIRFGAKIIDNIILGAVGAAVAVMGGVSVGLSNPNPTSFPPAMIAVIAFQYIFPVAYTTFFLGKFSATPGKMACGLKVVTADGQSISYLRAFGRYFAEIVSALIFCIGYIIAAFDYEKRTLHDRICTTRVIKN